MVFMLAYGKRSKRPIKSPLNPHEWLSAPNSTDLKISAERETNVISLLGNLTLRMPFPILGPRLNEDHIGFGKLELSRHH